jgi:hypothetical protein
MKSSTARKLTLTAVIAASSYFSHADIVLFKDNFESGNLNQWVGKSGGPTSGQIVADPLNTTNHVLTFSNVTFSGDIFSAFPLNVSLPRRYVLKLDFLGLPGAPENGAFIGFSDLPAATLNQFWVSSTYPPGLTAPPSVATALTADGQWRQYEIDFTEIVASNGLTQTFLMLEDWFDRGSVPGDAFFDNISVVGVFDVNSVLSQVPCEGPSPGKTWKNHGQYVSTVSKIVELYLSENLITQEEADAVMALAGNSDCGKPKKK